MRRSMSDPRSDERVPSSRALREIATRVRARLVRAELRFAPSEAQRLFILTIMVGVLCGLAAVAFHLAIQLVEHQLVQRAFAARGRWWILWGVLTPTLGAAAVGSLLHWVVPGARGSGVPQVKVAYASRMGAVRFRDAVGKFFLGALQIGSGSSLGREGPTVQICAGVASTLARLAQVSPQSRRKLIPVGAAAGIAAAFNAPIAAVTFTIEEVVGKLDQTVLSGVIVAAAVAAVIERSALGTHPVFDIPHPFALDDARSLVFYALLGVVAAMVSVVFTDALLGLRMRFRRQKLVPLPLQPAVGGLVTGLLAVSALQWLHVGGITGGGYEQLRASLSSELGVKVMLALCVLKLTATVFSYSSGGAGGIFAPSLFVGAMIGGSFGALDRSVFHHPDAVLGAFALVGMGAVFSATIRAPMTSVLIIVEMTSGYGLILPLMIANMSAYVLARHWRPEPIYEALLAQDDIHLRERATLDALDELALASVVERGGVELSFLRSATAREILERTEGSRREVHPVVDDDGHLIGLFTQHELGKLAGEPELMLLVTAADLMQPPVSVSIDDDLRTAFEVMRGAKVRELPVIDGVGSIVGFIDESTIARAYLRSQGPKSTRVLPRDEGPPSG
jgi:CIC family chloride channel protein